MSTPANRIRTRLTRAATVDGKHMPAGSIVECDLATFHELAGQRAGVPEGMHYQDNLLPEYKRSRRCR